MATSSESLSEHLATCLAADATRMWQSYQSAKVSEPHLGAHRTKKTIDENSEEDIFESTISKQEESSSTIESVLQDEPSAKESVDLDALQLQAHIAESLSRELSEQQKLVQACEAESRYVEIVTTVKLNTSDPLKELDLVITDKEDTGMEGKVSPKEKVETDKDEMALTECHNNQVYLAECLVRELAAKRSLQEACTAEGKYIEKTMYASLSESEKTKSTKEVVPGAEVPTATKDDNESERVIDGKVEWEDAGSDDQGAGLIRTEVEAGLQETGGDDDDKREDEEEQGIDQLGYVHKKLFIPVIETKDIGVNVSVSATEVSTSTMDVELNTQSTNTEPLSLKETGCNTSLSCFDLMQRVKEMEELEFLKAEHQVALTQLNKERSQRMVAEQLAEIVQSDVSNLRERNISETTTRLRLENELSDAKGELSYTKSQLEEKEQRITELEESLSGTSLLVRKLEEQNAVSLMSRGGIDYMLQARLAEGRAQEAEQKLEVLQTELLQSQGEVRRLLDRLSESSRDRSEMVSSKVHTQLMQMADEKAMLAERRAQELEREVQELRRQLSLHDNQRGGDPYSSTRTNPTGYSGLTGLTGLSSGGGLGLFSTTSFGSSYSPYSSPYSTSQTAKLPSLTEQYNLKSSSMSSSYLSEPPPLMNGTPRPFSYTDSGSGSAATSGLLTNKTQLRITSHVTSNVGGDTLSSGEVKLEDTAEKAAEKDSATEHGDELTLPSFDLPAIPTTDAALPTTTSSVVQRSDGDDESSDWSSSSDEEGEGGEGGGGEDGKLVRPSHHTSLISEWEWRTTHDEEDGSVPQPHVTKRLPPPVAPKPQPLRKFLSSDTVTLESPSSFEEPTHDAALQLLSKGLKRVRGPRGRSLPSRYRSKQTSLFS